MASESLPSVMLITANVGSIFEDVSLSALLLLHTIYMYLCMIPKRLIGQSNDSLLMFLTTLLVIYCLFFFFFGFLPEMCYLLPKKENKVLKMTCFTKCSSIAFDKYFILNRLFSILQGKQQLGK